MFGLKNWKKTLVRGHTIPWFELHLDTKGASITIGDFRSEYKFEVLYKNAFHSSSLQAPHYHVTYPSHPMSYSLYLKPTWRVRALVVSLVWNLKIALILNLVLVVLILRRCLYYLMLWSCFPAHHWLYLHSIHYKTNNIMRYAKHLLYTSQKNGIIYL